MTFAEKIYKYRIEHDYSLQQLADILGTSKQVLSRYEKGDRLPKVDLANQFAQRLNVPLENLIDPNLELDGTNAPISKRDKSIETIMTLFNKLTDDQKMDMIMYAAELIGSNEKSTDSSSSAPDGK